MELGVSNGTSKKRKATSHLEESFQKKKVQQSTTSIQKHRRNSSHIWTQNKTKISKIK